MKGYQYKNAYYANRQINAEENVIKQLKRKNEELEKKLAAANSVAGKKDKEIEHWQDRHDELLNELGKTQAGLEKAKKAIKNAPIAVDIEKREKEIFAVCAKRVAKQDLEIVKLQRAIAAQSRYIAELEEIVMGN